MGIGPELPSVRHHASRHAGRPAREPRVPEVAEVVVAVQRHEIREDHPRHVEPQAQGPRRREIHDGSGHPATRERAHEVLARHLAVMDTTATSLSMDNHIPVQVFALKDPQNILRVVMGEPIGTIVKEEL